jgi:hypothetical protein
MSVGAYNILYTSKIYYQTSNMLAIYFRIFNKLSSTLIDSKGQYGCIYLVSKMSIKKV